MKEQNNIMARDLSETDISNMLDGEFKATIIKIQTGPENRIEDISEMITIEIRELKTNRDEE